MTAAAISHCARCDSPLERGDLRCAICAEVVPSSSGKAHALEVQLLRCDGCGAAVTFDAKLQGLSCAFCDSLMHLEVLTDPVEQTESWVPFTVPQEEAHAALKAWLSRLGWFRPSDLSARARIEALRPLWWVAWTFDATVRVSWAADSNAGSGRSSWAPHSGQVELHFDDIPVSASRGLTDDETQELAPFYDLATAKSAPDELEGATFETFDVQRSAARRRILKEVKRASLERVQQAHIPGSSYRNVHVSPLLRGLETHRYSLPAYVMAYRYNGELYRAVVCGQDAGCVTGKAPYSLMKILLVAGVALALGLAVARVIVAQ